MLIKIRAHQNPDRALLRMQDRQHPGAAGNVLIYVVVLMLIFGALGVAMVSLFASSTASTVTRNDTRRSRYLSESGVRYAIGEMRKEDFDEDYIIDPLNTLTYTVSDAGSFEPNVFGPWFDSDASVDSPDVISISPRLGEIPTDFTTTALTDVWVVNYDFITGDNPNLTTMRDTVNSYTINGTSLDVDITSDFVANIGERVCLAVEPIGADQDITEGGNLIVARDARFFFPPFNGAININRVDYAYARLVDDEANGRVILENVTADQFPNTYDPFPPTPRTLSRGGGGSPYPGDFVILSPRNYMVMAEGTSDAVTWGDAYGLGMGVYDDSLIRPGSRKPDITAEDFVTNLSEQETDSRFFERNLTDYELDIGGGGTDEFGSAFYNATRDIGGERDYCQQGACLFAEGVRAFFLVKFNGQGEGITFTLLGQGFPPGQPNNSATSVGGDFQLSELMGYAGDSRLVANPDPLNDADFLATNPDDRGLEPPKIAIEFDTQTNEPIFNFCSGANANPDTRNDPVPEGNDNKDVVQFVYWGREVLDIACRDDNPTYDDNRHNPDDWIYTTGDEVRSSPAVAIAADGTIYVGSDDSNLYAVNPDGTLKWIFSDPTGPVQSSPAIATDGTIYVGSDDGHLYAVTPGGSLDWKYPPVGSIGAVKSSPAIGSDGSIYFGSDDGFMYAVTETGALKPTDWPVDTANASPTCIDLNPCSSTLVRAEISLGRPAIATDGTIYFSALNTGLYARNPDGTEKWTVSLGPLGPGSNNDYMPGVDTVAGFGFVYTDVPGNAVAALNPTNGNKIWSVDVRSDVDSTPVVGPDGTIYFGTDGAANALFAITPGPTQATTSINWEFTTGADVDNTPALNADGSEVYVVSTDENLYAVDTALGTELWRFPIPVNAIDGVANSSPAVGADGTVYVGSTDNNLYAVGRPIDPRNIRELYLTNDDLDSTVMVNNNINWLNGDANRGSWAVRLEVDRTLIANGEGKYDYDVRLWIRQCLDNTDFPCDNILGTFFVDTRVEYDYTAVVGLPLRQSFSLSQSEHDAFERFFFGFTGAAGAQALDATISKFQLSFSRPGDSVISCDSINWPTEAPLPGCVPEL